jgi:hypothetical protein
MGNAHQKKVLGIITQAIVDNGLDPVHRGRFANTGSVGIQLSTKPVDIALVNYDFQDGTMKFSIYVKSSTGAMVGVQSQPPRKDYFDFYLKYEDERGYDRFHTTLMQELKKLRPKQPRGVQAPPPPPVEAEGLVRDLVKVLDDSSPLWRAALPVLLDRAERFLAPKK